MSEIDPTTIEVITEGSPSDLAAKIATYSGPLIVIGVAQVGIRSVAYVARPVQKIPKLKKMKQLDD